MATRLSTPKEMMTCQKCGNTQEKDKAFFVSYSPLHGATGRVPICKSCLNEYDFYDKKEIIEVLRAIDKPFKEVIYESCITGKDRAMLGKYIRMLSLSHKMETFSDSDGIIQENKSMLQVKSQIEQKRSELEQLQGAINELNQEVENKKKKIEIDDELIKKWGKGYEPDEYEMFENKFKLIESSYPIKSTMHYESLKLYVLYACRAELAIKEGDADEANKWGKLAQQQATQAKITPQNLTSADLSQGLDNFSSLAIAVEKAVDIIPLIPTYIEKGQDKADMMILFYINYERKLKGLPECTHEEVYNFYNEMIQSYIENNPSDYSFLISKDEDDNRPLITRVYDWVFNVRIPEEKRKHPHDPFYQNLDKWTTLVSYLRWFPDAFYRLITPKEGGIKLGLDQCVLLRALSRFKHVYDVQGRGSGKCVAYDTIIPTENGLIEIGELFDYKVLEDEEEIVEQNIGVLNRYGNIEKSNKGIISGHKPTRKIRTLYGYDIETSLNHPLLTLNHKGILEYKQAKDLEEGDYLCINRKGGVFGKNDSVSINMAFNMGADLDAYYNEVPRKIRTAPKEVVVSFLEGLYSTRGYDNTFEVYSDKLSKHIQLLLLNLGVISKRTWKINKVGEKVFKIEVDLDYKYDYFYTPIVEIEEWDNYVCDIQMPETHSFVGNGIVNHNTFIEQLYTYHTMTFYPYCDISMSAQTLANASSLVKDKYSEIMKFYPLLKNECIEKECRFTENNTEVRWKSGSILTTLANAQSSKGKRRKRLLIEESAQVNDKLYEDVLEPIVNVPRITLGSLGIISPIELNGSIHFFTTSWYKNTSEYHRNIKFFDDMCELKGTFILGASWELNALFGRGEPKSSVMRKKESLSPTMFALNYMSEWVGATDGALISIEKVMNIRNVTQAELEWDKKSEYIIGCDVARSGHKENNQSSIVVLKLIKNKNGKLINVVCVNIKNYPATTNFSTLAQNLMKFKMRYNAKAVVVDSNGLGGFRPS